MLRKQVLFYSIIFLLSVASSASSFSGSVDKDKAVSAIYGIKGGSNYELDAKSPCTHTIKVTVRPGDTVLFQITGSTVTDISHIIESKDILVGPSNMEITMLGSGEGVKNEKFSAGTSHTISREMNIPIDGSGIGPYTGVQTRVKTHWYLIKGYDDGSTTILGSRYVTVRVELILGSGQELPSEVAVTSVKIINCPGSSKILSGAVVRLNAAVSPDNATNKKVNWSVDNSAVASISPDGTLTAKAPGIVTVIASSAENPQIKDQCKIQVSGEADKPQPVSVASVQITNCPGSLDAGKSIQMITVVSPANAQNKNINWSVDNQSVATIQSNGILTAKAVGTVTITASSAENPQIKDHCHVTVTKPAENDPTIRITNCPGQVGVGSTGQMKAAVDPPRDPNGKDWRIGWFVDNPSIININNDTGFYQALKTGQVTVSAYLYEKPLVQSYCIIVIGKSQVTPKPDPGSPPPSKPPTQDPPKPKDLQLPPIIISPPDLPSPPDEPTKPTDGQTVIPPPADYSIPVTPDPDVDDNDLSRVQPPRHQSPPGNDRPDRGYDAPEPEPDSKWIFDGLKKTTEEELLDFIPGKSLYDWFIKQLPPEDSYEGAIIGYERIKIYPKHPRVYKEDDFDHYSTGERVKDLGKAIFEELTGAKGWIAKRLYRFFRSAPVEPSPRPQIDLELKQHPDGIWLQDPETGNIEWYELDPDLDKDFLEELKQVEGEEHIFEYR